MKTINQILSLFLLSLILLGCQKMDLTEDLEMPQRTENQLSPNSPTNLIVQSTSSTQYGVQELLDFLSVYGTATPDITPAFNNYYQDIGVGGSTLGQLSQVDGALFISNQGTLINDTLNYSFEWYINGVLQCIEANPKLWDLDDNLICDGVVELTLVIKNLQRGSIFERTQWAYLGYNYIDNCQCASCPPQILVFYDFYPEVDPYHFMTSPDRWDFNANGLIDSSDLTTFLAYYGG